MHFRHIIWISILGAGICGTAPVTAHEISGAKCTVNTTDLFKVVIGDVNKTPNIHNILNFSCTWPSYAVKDTDTVYYCFHIHGKGNGETSFDYRYADYSSPLRETNKQISFNFYSQGKKVGNRVEPHNITGRATRVSKRKATASPTLTVDFEGNTTDEKIPGYYSYNDPQTHVIMTAFRPGELVTDDAICRPDTAWTKPGDIWGDGEEKGKTKVTVEVRTYCQVSTEQDIKFYTVTRIDEDLHAKGIVKVDCSGGTEFDVAINDGLHVSDKGVRQMHGKKTGIKIPYTIEPEKWSGIGTGTPEGVLQAVNATVNVPDTQPYVDKYSDTLVVTLTQHV